MARHRNSEPPKETFKSLSYRFLGCWLLYLLLFVFWIIPLAIAMAIGAFSLVNVHYLQKAKEGWSGIPQKDNWTWSSRDLR